MTRPVNTILAITIIVIIAAIIGGVIWWQFSQQAKEIVSVGENMQVEREMAQRAEEQAQIQQNEQNKTSTEEWEKYIFTNTDDYHTRAFELLYPSSGSIIKDDENGGADKLVYKMGSKDCGLIILPPPTGIESEGSDFSTDQKDIILSGQEWGNLVWKRGNEIVLYGFKNYEDTAYFFQASLESLIECADSYNQILSTFKFTK